LYLKLNELNIIGSDSRESVLFYNFLQQFGFFEL
jgi:hypothetical protein